MDSHESAKLGEFTHLRSRMKMRVRTGCLAKVICYLCYDRGHIAVDCTCGIGDMPKVISKFEKLSESEKKFIPDTYYQNVLCFFRGRPECEPTKDVSDASQPKN